MPATPLAIPLPPLLLSLCLLTPFVRRLAARLSRFVPRLPSLAAGPPSPMLSLALFVLSRSNHAPPPRPASGRPSGGTQPRLKSQPAASAMPPNPAKMHPAAPQEFLGRNSYCARGPNLRPSRPPPPIARTHPRRRPSRSHSSALAPLPFRPRPAAPQEFFGKNSYARKATPVRPLQPPPAANRPNARLFLPRPLGEGRGEGLPGNTPRFSTVASAHSPSPPQMPLTAPQEFFRKNSYCARGPNLRPSRPPPPTAQPHPCPLPSRSHSSAHSPLPFLPRPTTLAGTHQTSEPA